MVRDARPEDAPAICEVLKRSILELCDADHQHDPAILARWLRNKTPERVLTEMLLPGNSMLVAVENAAIVGAGLVDDMGEIHLNYVAPEARFRGVSRQIIHALEARARERGNTHCTLTSTETARRFYISGGYTEKTEVVLRFPGDCPGYRMSKLLASNRIDGKRKE